MKSFVCLFLLIFASSCIGVDSISVADARKYFPDASSLKRVESGKNFVPQVQLVFADGAALLGVEATIKARTKSGYYRLVTYVDVTGVVRGVEVRGHASGNSPSLNQKRFISQFVGKNLFEHDALEGEFDAVSSATISSRSMVTYLRRARPVIAAVLSREK